ncbi:MAG: OmpA family protein [Bacteroidales bacterium]|nr:OmpA family protein [Bacteroidales bacterium]
MNTKSIIVLVGAALIISACVPMNRLNSVEEIKNELATERDALMKSNQKLVVDTTEMGAELRKLNHMQSSLVEDTLQLGKSLRRMKDNYEKAVAQNKELMDSKEKLARGSEAEARKLLAELQASKADLQKQKDDLVKLEDKLWERKKSLELLQSELENKDKMLEEKNLKMSELEKTLARKDSAVQALKDKVAAALYQFEKDGLTVNIRNGKVYVSLDEQLLFKTGKFDVDPKGKAAIEKLAKVLEQNPDINVMIEGHTDNVPYNGKGQLTDNWDLSVKRATAIVRIITSGSKVDGKRLTASGRGEYVPLDKANTPEARQKNRRTEIILTPKLDELFEVLESN